ncbi:hypothetical protein BU26DRAFT_50404 [Trematosphaeria pertusa]|uniref:DUF6594 domain-containing protein n=1 Tax=Trematosphaeria pertusa TaxID=390896 RepID=A0A6A6I8D5_9PLEO|nr:uncharacterized protein BU26DRAFT_50404 [Trematosphaeria pertusa]KAF2246631.1 hypothetical protein BU26DRAFT_50404 [Trematosphaeria pertusa]
MVEKQPKDQDTDQGKSTRTPSESDASTASSSSDGSTKAKPELQKPTRRRSRFVSWLIGSHPEDVSDGRFDGLIYESVDDYQIGYPRWAAFQNSDPTFRVYKRFGTLRNRLLLYRQFELWELEEELRSLDEKDHQLNNFKTRSLMIDGADTESKRVKLMDQIETKLKQYDDLLEREIRSGLLHKPSRRGYRNLVNYIWNKKPVVKAETQFLKYRDDFVQLSERSESPLENLIDYVVCNWIPTRWLRRLFSSDAQISKSGDKFTTLPSPRKVFVLARLIATALAILLIGIPLSVLTAGAICETTKLIVLIVSLFVFPAVISLAARPRTLELFVATAT